MELDDITGYWSQSSPVFPPSFLEMQREVRRNSDATLAGEEDKEKKFLLWSC
jgi:hypothetical protein